MRRLLIDGDLILYRTLFALQVDVQDGEWVHPYVNVSDACAAIDSLIEEYCAWFDAEKRDVTIAFSSPRNWRKEVYPQYKSNRATLRAPVGAAAVKEYIRATYDARTIEGLEADDVLGILSTITPNKAQIVSIDKDMKTVPGRLIVPDDAGGYVVHDISPDEANHNHMMQTLTGDSTDGYPGCPGIGEVKAAALLREAATPSERWQIVVKAFIEANQPPKKPKPDYVPKPLLTEEDALMQARMAHILTAPYWTPPLGVKLWTPP